MAAVYSGEELDYLFHHVFLPPKLPDASEDLEEKSRLETTLLKATIDSLRRYRGRCDSKDQYVARRALQGLQAALKIHDTTSRDINEDRLTEHLAAMIKDRSDAPVPLYIRAQNCGVLVGLDKAGMVLEAFELSPTNAKVMGSARLTRSFPTSSVLVLDYHATQTDFQTTVARTLASMASEAVAGMQPQIQKSGKRTEELRDTPNPAIVTKLFFGAFLESIGSHQEVLAVRKNTRDEVLWRDTLLPWRRSPMWLLIRVALQLVFHRAGKPEGYKRFMVAFMGDILNSALRSSLPAPVLYAMSAKISRRLIKIGSPLPGQFLQPLRDVLQATSQTLQDRWGATQRLEHPLEIEGLQHLSLDEDRLVELPELQKHLEMIANRPSKSRNTTFDPSESILQPSHDGWFYLPKALTGYDAAGLNSFEDWVETSLGQVMNAYEADFIIQEAHLLFQRYHHLARTAYADNPEALSSMILTLMEIWVCCDKQAISECEWLAEYEHGINLDAFNSLLLPTRSQMKRLHLVEQHLRTRSGARKVLSSALLCGETTDSKCFAARYFDFDGRYQDLMDGINARSDQRRVDKLAQLERLKDTRNELKQSAEKEPHGELVIPITDRYGRVIGEKKDHDDANCKKCKLLDQANETCIDVYEWPLPAGEIKSKVIVFELQPPVWFATWRDCTSYLIMDVLKSTYIESKRPPRPFTLEENDQLQWAYKPGRSRESSSADISAWDSNSESSSNEKNMQLDRIVMVSKQKPFKSSHYKSVNVTDATTEKDVIVPSGAKYHYFDSFAGCFVAPRRSTETMAHACTYRMPDRSQALERYLLRTAAAPDGEPPNSAISNQFTCPIHMTVKEFLELCSVPYGHLLQWRHIAVQLHAPGVDLRKEETALVFLQTIYQTGPPVLQYVSEDYDSLRASHLVTGQSNLQKGLLLGLNESLDHTKENYESANAVLILAAIAARLTSLSASTSVQKECLDFLERCRGVASGWLVLLRSKMQEASGSDRTDFLNRCIEVACVCMLTFDLEGVHLRSVLQSDEQATTFLQCSVILSELGGGAAPRPGSTTALLKLRFQRLLYRSRDIIQHKHSALDNAIQKSWAAYRPGSAGWIKISDTWMVKDVTLSSGDEMSVHFDLLAGELRVNGERLKRTPVEYETHPLYATLFGKVGVEVLQSRVPGMRFSAKKEHGGFGVHLNLKDGRDLFVQARDDRNTFETVPDQLFRGLFPDLFVDGFVQWYNAANNTIEFRPKVNPWPSESPDKWILSREHSSDRWSLSKDGICLMATTSPTTKQISRLLSPLIPAPRVHVFLDESRARIHVDLPSLQLGFFFHQGTSHLVSKEFRSMAVDADQQLGTLIGFRNKLLLRHIESGDRLALVPEGTVSYRVAGDHVTVTVDRASVSKVHPIHVDPRLGRLVDNGSMQCKLFMAYIHALTSFCLPDRLTRKSGVEQSLTILKSAAVRSFDQLTDANKALLALIAKLSPSREYYPQDDKIMQIVTWDSELSFLSQHGWFYRAVKAIFAQAKRSSFFHPETPLRLPKIDRGVEALLDRDCIRSSVFQISEFGAEDHTARHDAEYSSGDRNQLVGSSANAFRLCFAVVEGIRGPIWKAPTLKQLWDPLEKVSVVAGSHGELDMVRYDAALLAGTEAPIIQNLLPLQFALAQSGAGDKPFDKYRLMIWLATIAFSPKANMEIVQIPALLSTISGNSVPDVEYCSPMDGRTCKTSAAHVALTELVNEFTVDYRRSPEYLTAPRPRETTSQMAEARRQNDFANKKKNAVKEFVTALRKQWPVKEPKMPSKPCPEWVADYIETDKALEKVKPMFKAWFNNEQLHQYLEKVADSVAGLKRVVIDPPDGIDGSSGPATQPAVVTHRCLTIDHLFSGPAPVLLAQETQPPRLEITQMAATAGAAAAADESRLGILIEDMKSVSIGFETEYLELLQGSFLSLQSRQMPAFAGLPSLFQVQSHLRFCGDHVVSLYGKIQAAMRDNQDAFVGHTQPWHSPRVSPMLLLQQLSWDRWHKLSDPWKQLMVQYGLALAAHQRAERLLRASISSNRKALIKELRNTGHANWSASQAPEWLLLEVESGILVREVQAEIAAEMRSPQGGGSNILQLNMGEGKSSVIVPMVASALANGSQLVRVIVAKPQSKQMAQMLVSKLGNLLGRQVFFLPFSRAVEPTQAMADAMQSICQEAMTRGGVMLVQPEHILSFKLMSLESYISLGESEHTQVAQKAHAAKHVMRIQDFLDQNARDIVDESDDIFSTRFELVYTLGKRRDIELAPNRWQYIQEVLDLARIFGKDIVESRPSALEYNDRGEGGFPRIRILEHDAGDLLVGRIAQEICEKGTLGFRVNEADRDAVSAYITKFDLSREEIAAVEESKFWSANKTTLLLFRGLFATGILAFALEQKRWRVHYGLTDRLPKTRLAVPYRAKDSPTPRSEYSHPDVVILLTSLSYYYGGLSDNDLFLAFTHLMKSDNAPTNYSAWISDVSIPMEFRRLSGINLHDRATCTSLIFPHLRHAKGAVDYFLSNLVFARELREYPNKLSTSGWDVAKVKGHPTTGFSGTNDSRVCLPASMNNVDLPSQNHTNALVLNHLLQPQNSVATMPNAGAHMSDAERLLDMVINMQPAIQVILDVGAQILELNNEGVAKTWLWKCADPRKEAAVFCNDADELVVVDRRGIKELLQTSSYSTRLDVCLVYLDEAHTRGIDLKLPHDSRAAVTLGAGLTKDRLVQACMRMRELGKGQTVVFCANEEICAKIRSCDSRPHDGILGVEDVIRWSILQTWDEMRRSMPLWAMQGHRFIVQQRLWSQKFDDGKTIMTPERAVNFLEKEAKTIESRYRPGDRFTTALDKLSKSGDPQFMELAQRCRTFDRLHVNSRRFQEEQERELLAESEEERVVEAAIPAEPATHHLSKALVQLVKAGKLVDKRGNVCFPPSTFQTAFTLLKKTTVASELNVDQLIPDAAVLATLDFGKTIEDLDVDSAADSFQRPVQWVLTIRPRGADVATLVVLVSPFEAQELTYYVLASPFAALHLYKPRCNLSYRPTDQLGCLTSSSVLAKISIPMQLSVQINVFAGALYFNSFQEYVETCKFLGLASGLAKNGWEVDPDGFIQKDEQGRKGGGSGLQKSPIKFLKALLMKIRRTGDDINVTDMGKLLEGKLLKPDDFVGRE
ncbi:hypothetical protein PRZ48_004575 [Zasmidium cellare]|uniref:ubiquitinyl hydrolase 1 n=1 Tax=Zasmidium cellare TaxID=395010 RepID=A0ABR0EQ83_ZASCE|nr:hypothetical protein PRZ48_004575 [Zasmidium cellare]